MKKKAWLNVIVTLGVISLLAFSSSSAFAVMPSKNLRERNELSPSTVRPQKFTYVEGEVLVKLKKGRNRVVVDRLADSLPVAVKKRFRRLSERKKRTYILLKSRRVMVGPGIDRPEKSTMELVAELSKNPQVAAVSPNYYRYKANIPSDSLIDQLWGLHNTGQTGGTVNGDIDAPEAWDVRTDCSSVILASIDSGVDYTHEDLAANMWINPGETPDNGLDDDGNGYVDDVFGIDAGEDDSDPMDDDGHGTHTAGTMAAVGNNGAGVAGVCWKARIMAVKVEDPDGQLKDSDLIESITYVTAMKTERNQEIAAINASWGGNGYNQLLYDAIEDAGDAGIVFVAAAGNSGYDNDEWPYYPSGFNLWNIISVAASNHFDGKPTFTNYGLVSVDLAAPGENILSTVPGYDDEPGSSDRYEYFDGTSMAAPHVTGAVGLLASDPSIDAKPADEAGQQIVARILKGVDEKSAFSYKVLTSGRLNVNTSLQLGDLPFVKTAVPHYGTPPGSRITISGMNFGESGGDLLWRRGSSEVSVEVQRWSDKTIEFYVPEAAAPYSRIEITVENAGGRRSNPAFLFPKRYWVNGDALPFSTRFGGGVIAHEGKLYCIQGEFYQSGGHVGVYDPASATWRTSASMPEPVVNRPFDVGLGLDESEDPVIVVFSNSFDDHNGIYRFNLRTETWDSKPFPAGFPAEGLVHLDMVSMLNYTGRNICYISGGRDSSALWEYHPDTNTIINLGSFTIAGSLFEHTSYFVNWIGSGGAVCVMGGYGVAGDTQCYDIASGGFNAPNTDIPQLPGTIVAAADIQANGDLWILGGKFNTDRSHRTYRFNSTQTDWIQGPSLIYPVRWGDGASLNDTLYLVGGEYAGDATWFNQILFPAVPFDTDGDGLPDAVENDSPCLDPADVDTDDDGIADGVEDADHDGVVAPGETDPCLIDTDDDGIQDGTEIGVTQPVSDPDGDVPLLGTDTEVFIPDADPDTTTDPRKEDSDDDGVLDGVEDGNHNGLVESWETDPADRSSVPAAIVHLSKGFNLVAVHAAGELGDWLAALGDETVIEKVMAFDQQAGRYVTLIPGDPTNENVVLDGSEGLVVYAGKDKSFGISTVTCSGLYLKSGLNLIGIACPPDGYSAFQLLSDLGDDSVTSIQRYDTGKGMFESAGFNEIGKTVGIDFPIFPGNGYMIYLTLGVENFKPE